MPTKFTQLVLFCTLSMRDKEVKFNPMYHELATKRLHYFIFHHRILKIYEQARSNICINAKIFVLKKL